MRCIERAFEKYAAYLDKDEQTRRQFVGIHPSLPQMANLLASQFIYRAAKQMAVHYKESSISPMLLTDAKVADLLVFLLFRRGRVDRGFICGWDGRRWRCILTTSICPRGRAGSSGCGGPTSRLLLARGGALCSGSPVICSFCLGLWGRSALAVSGCGCGCSLSWTR